MKRRLWRSDVTGDVVSNTIPPDGEKAFLRLFMLYPGASRFSYLSLVTITLI